MPCEAPGGTSLSKKQPTPPTPKDEKSPAAVVSPRLGFKARGISADEIYSMMPHMGNAVTKARERQRTAKNKPLNGKSTVFPVGRTPYVYRHLVVKPPQKIAKATTGQAHLQHAVSDLSGDKDVKAKLRRELLSTRRDGKRNGAQTARPAARRAAAAEEEGEQTDDAQEKLKKVRRGS